MSPAELRATWLAVRIAQVDLATVLALTDASGYPCPSLLAEAERHAATLALALREYRRLVPAPVDQTDPVRLRWGRR